MNWFIPALVNSGASGWCGISPAEGTSVWPRSTKNSREGATKRVGIHVDLQITDGAPQSPAPGPLARSSASRSRMALRPFADGGPQLVAAGPGRRRPARPPRCGPARPPGRRRSRLGHRA